MNRRKALNVAEKPSVYRAISKLPGNGRQRSRAPVNHRGNRGMPIYDFTYNINGEDVEMVFTSVRGHLMNCGFKPPFNKWGSCLPIELFQAEIRRKDFFVFFICPKQFSKSRFHLREVL